MKRTLVFISLLFTSILFSQNLSVCRDHQNKKYGYCDESGNIVIDRQYFYAYKFDGEYAIIQKEYKGPKGVINKQGKTIIPFEYDDIRPFKNGNFILEKDSLMVGIISPNHDTILPFYQTKWGIPFEYSYYEYRRDLLPVNFDSVGFIIKRGHKMDYVLGSKIMFDFQYDMIRKMTVYFDNYETNQESFDFFLVKEGKQLKMINLLNQRIFDFPAFDTYYSSWTRGSDPVRIVIKNGEKLFYDLYEQKVLTDISGSPVTRKVNAKIMVEDDKYGLMGPDRSMIMPYQYDMIIRMNYFPDYYILNKDSLWGIMTLDGDTIQPFDELVESYINSFFMDGDSYMAEPQTYMVQRDGKLAICFLDGRRAFEFTYDKLGMLYDGPDYQSKFQRIYAGTAGNIKIYDINENQVSDLVFDDVFGMWPNSTHAVVKHQGQIKYYDIVADTLVTKKEVDQYSKCSQVRNIYGYYGMFDAEGNQHLPFEYHFMSCFNSRCNLEKDGKRGLIRMNEDKTFGPIKWFEGDEWLLGE